MQTSQTENKLPDSFEQSGVLTVSVSEWIDNKPGLLAEIQASGVLLAINIDTATALDVFDADIARISAINIHFPDVMDGRGFSQAAMLRETHGFNGTLRAVNVLADNIPFMQQCGFDSFALENGELLETGTAEADRDILSAIELAGQLGRERFSERPD